LSGDHIKSGQKWLIEVVNEKDVVEIKAEMLNVIYYGMCAMDRLAALLVMP